MQKFCFSFFILCSLNLLAQYDRRPIEDIINGDAFRSIAHFIYEDEFMRDGHFKKSTHAFNNSQTSKILDNLKAGDIIYVQYGVTDSFLKKVHPKITKPYFLISHFGDEIIDKRHLQFLNDPKIIRWYAHNIDLDHEKLTPTPHGIGNRFWLKKIRCSNYEEILSNTASFDTPREDTVYMNFNAGTYTKERTLAFNSLKDKAYTRHEGPVEFQKYIEQLKKHRYCLSPAGNGVGCVRTWEALLMGCIPILRPMNKLTNAYAKGYDSLYEGLPVIIVKEWSEVTPEFLSRKLEEFEHMDLKLEKIYFPYWRDLILSESEKYKRAHINN
jgi:hypothetical protein